MIALEEPETAAYVGIRSTFYRVATIVGQGLLVLIAGVIESNTGLEPADVTITADATLQPKTEVVNALPEAIVVTPEQANVEQFVFSAAPTVGTQTPETVSIKVNDSTSTEVKFADYSKSMMDSVHVLNALNGFVTDTTVVKDGKLVAKVEKKEEVKKQDGPNAFEQWIKNTFGEDKKTDVKAAANNFAIVGVRLTKAPSEEECILVVNYKDGDQSIKLNDKVVDTRFVFTKDNWDKTAYIYFEIDKNIKGNVTATFQGTSGNIPMAWLLVFVVLSVFFLCAAMYHSWVLPVPANDKSVGGGEKASAKEIINGFLDTFKTFFQKKGVWVAMAFMLLYRLPEAQLVKIINPFFLDPVDKGGLGLTTGQVGIVYGTIGIIGLTLGGILGGIVASKGGLKKWLWPMALSISLNSVVYIFLSAVQPDPNTVSGFLTISAGMVLDQFGYGFGFTAFMLYMMYFADGPYKTSHYAICTAFMALGMMLPGMWSGWLQELVGYNHFFIWTLLCCLGTWAVTAMVKVDPNYGKKKKELEKE
jgi:PAT family beta-lactamase induction signal transducer AmpG